MKSYIVLLGCFALISSAHSSKELSCPAEPKTCFFYRNVIDYQVREVIRLADFVADVTFTEDKCFGKMHINQVHYGVLDQLNGTELTVALKTDCRQQQKWKPNEKYCLAVDEFQFEHKQITLDENVLLIAGQCDVSQSVRPQLRKSQVQPTRDSSTPLPRYMRNYRRSLVHRMTFEKGFDSLTDYYGSSFKKADSCIARPTTCPACQEWVDEDLGKKILDYSDIIAAKFVDFGDSGYKLNVSSVIKSSSGSPLANEYNFVLNYKCYDTCKELDSSLGMLILMKDGGTRKDGCFVFDDKLIILPHVYQSKFELKSALWTLDSSWTAKKKSEF